MYKNPVITATLNFTQPEFSLQLLKTSEDNHAEVGINLPVDIRKNPWNSFLNSLFPNLSLRQPDLHSKIGVRLSISETSFKYVVSQSMFEEIALSFDLTSQNRKLFKDFVIALLRFYNIDITKVTWVNNADNKDNT